MTDHTNQSCTGAGTDLLQTNPLLSNDAPVENSCAVLRMLLFLDLRDKCLGDEGADGHGLVLDWIQRSLAYKSNLDLLQTNPLLTNGVTVENTRAVLAMLAFLDLSDECLGEEGNFGLYLVLEWVRHSLAYTGHTGEVAIPPSSPVAVEESR